MKIVRIRYDATPGYCGSAAFAYPETICESIMAMRKRNWKRNRDVAGRVRYVYSSQVIRDRKVGDGSCLGLIHGRYNVRS